MLVGKQLGPFKVEKELGSGAMGSVFGGVDPKGRKVAIKIIAPGLVKNETAIERFLRESKVLKRLSHPNIARYVGSGRYHGTPFYIMEFIQGESLDHILERRIKISWEEVVQIGTQLCAALQVAHDAGIIHRDLKPSNLMILPDGSIKLTDFGIAKDTDASGLTATHSTLGTAAYMSPEQCRGAKDITFKSDLYSMGVMFYELVTGHKPFTADNPMDVFLMHVKGKCARPSTFTLDLPIWMDNLICNLMEKNPDDRPQSAAKVAEMLNDIAKKVAEQTSAGVDRASKRRADRTVTDTALDETDKDIARTLLGKKKKKARALPVYARNWFTGVALGVIGLAAIALVYGLFIKAPSGESLHRQAAALMKSDDPERHKEARDPIDNYLRYYPDGANARDMLAWRDQIDVESIRFYIKNERKSPTDPKEAWQAVKDESEGRLAEARKGWAVVKDLPGTDTDQRAWKVFAALSLADIERADRIEKTLSDRVRNEDLDGVKPPASEVERHALVGLRAQRDDNAREAKNAWDELRRLSEQASDWRPYHLLALKRLRETQ